MPWAWLSDVAVKDRLVRASKRRRHSTSFTRVFSSRRQDFFILYVCPLLNAALIFIWKCRYARFIFLKSNMKRCFIRTTPSVYPINETCCISANLTTAHDRETSCLPSSCSKDQQRWKSGRENKNKSECAGLLIERSALFMSALASELPMTFD